MSDVASLGFAIDSSQAVRASSDLDKLTSSSKRAEGAADDASKSQNKLATSLEQMRRQYDSSYDKQSKLTQAIKTYNSAVSAGLITHQQASVELEKIKATLGLLPGLHDKNSESVRTQRMQIRALAEAFGNTGTEMSALINKSGLLYLAMNHISASTVAAVVTIGSFALAARQLITIIKDAAEIGHTAQFANIGGQNLQGLLAAGGFKGLDSDVMLKSMIGLNQQVELAKSGLGSLSALFRLNGIAATTTEDAFFKIADLVKNARNEEEKRQIIVQAGLPVSNQMVLLLQQGSTEIRHQAEESRKLSDQQLQQAEKLEHQWNELWTNFERWGKGAIVATGETINRVFDDSSRRAGTALGDKLKGMGLNVHDAIPKQMTQAEVDAFYGAVPGASKSPTQMTVNANPTVNPDLLKQQLDLEKQRITILGQTASVAKEVRLAEIDLQIAGINNVGVTKAQRDSLLELARERALGITGIKAQIDSTNVQSAALLMSAGDAAEYTAKQTILNEAIRNHKVLTDEDKTAIDKQAKALGDAAAAADQIKKINDMGGAFMSGFFTDLSHGVKAVDALKSALTRLSDTLIDMISRQLFARALGGAIGGGGFFGGSPANNPNLVPIGSAHGNVFYGGNIIPFARGGIVNRPTLFAGGTALMGEAGPEAVVPLKRGSDGNLGIAGGGGSKVTVNLYEAPAGSRQEVSQDASGNVNVDIMFDQNMAKHMGTTGSQTQKALRSQGVAPRTARR